MPRAKTALFFLMPVLVAAGIFFMGARIDSKHSFEADVEAAASNNIPQQSAPQQNNMVQSTKDVFSVNAQAVVAMTMDGNNTVLYGQSQNKQLPIASLTKLMTALIVMNHYDLDQEVTISPTAMAVQGEQGQLKLGEQLPVRSLLYIMLIESSNRAAQAISEVMGTDAFVMLMNKQASDMGLSGTYFQDVSGLDPHNQSTAADVAKLSAYLFENYPLFNEIVGLGKFDLYAPDGVFHHTLVNTNQLLGEDGIVGGKTGYTDEAQGCVMVMQNLNGHKIISVILGAADRFGEMKKLVQFNDTNNI